MEETEALSEERLQKAITFTITSGYQLDKEAFDFLKSLSQDRDPVQLMEEAVKKLEDTSEKTLFINRGFLEETAGAFFPKEEEEAKLQPPPIEARKAFHAYAEDIDADIKVIEDPTDKISGSATLEDYLEYFQDRFRKLERILRKRIDARGATSISEALKAPNNSNVKIVGMITEKREAKQKLILRIEDLETSTSLLVPSSAAHEILDKARRLLLDQVVCVSATKIKNDLLIADDFIWPDVPQKKQQKASMPVCAALISDLHVGSKKFMAEAFERFILWLNGKFGSTSLRDLASHVKYVVIAGDLVDGIGIYPGQIGELAIKDVYKQYREVSKIIEQLPDYIEVIIIPGNHDASRKALPQPALPREYAEPLLELRKIYSLGDPSTVRLHQVELLLYHGRSLDDVIASVPNMNFHTPEKAMRLLLQCRHVAPIYGERTLIAPEKQDFMVIENPPDIFHAGHVHVLRCDTYRGSLIINSGAWQDQTEFQRKMGLVPTPGIAPIVNLQTLQVTTVNFT